MIAGGRNVKFLLQCYNYERMKLNCLVVDDEPLAQELLVAYVERTPFLHLVAKCSSALEALQVLREQPVDLIFLDIQMPEWSGLELSKVIDNRIKVIFTTAFENYAVEGYRVNALDYLLKPISYPEFLRATEKALIWFSQGDNKSGLPEEKKFIFVKSNYKLLRIDLDRICYIEGLKDYVKIYLEEEKQPVVSLASMKALEDILEGASFIRVHRSYIVNADKISLIDHNRIVFGNNYIPVSDSYKEKFAEFLEKRMLK